MRHQFSSVLTSLCLLVGLAFLFDRGKLLWAAPLRWIGQTRVVQLAKSHRRYQGVRREMRHVHLSIDIVCAIAVNTIFVRIQEWLWRPDLESWLECEKTLPTPCANTKLRYEPGEWAYRLFHMYVAKMSRS